MITKALFTGSFDPLTMGHLNIIERAAGMFDEVTVGIIENPSKSAMFTLEERENMIKETVKNLENVNVDHFSGLLADYVDSNGYNVIVRGIRNSIDFEYENQMAQINSRLLKGRAETVFLVADPQLSYLSSSMAKEVFGLGGSIEGLVPESILENMRKK